MSQGPNRTTMFSHFQTKFKTLGCCHDCRIQSDRVSRSSSANASVSSKPSFNNANFPTTSEGRTYHLGTKAGLTSILLPFASKFTRIHQFQNGEVANRILSVGATQRAELLSKLLEPSPNGGKLFRYLSTRGFLTVTGKPCVYPLHKKVT
jgi:hypothetical protein